jgi:glutamate-ammonia-ligase adenylyltransferase
LISELSKFPYLFDELIYEKLDELVIREKYDNLLSFLLKKQNFFESLNLLADFKIGCVFISTISLLEKKISIKEYSNLLSLVADSIVKISFELSCHHNNFFPDRLNLVAFGRYGSKEMGPNSDLDLLFLCEDDVYESKKYTTLIKTFTNILSTITHFGMLYKVDFRLRPNGDQGFLLSNFNAFLKYHGSSAFWEKLVFTRSRIIIGSNNFQITFKKSIKKILFDSLFKVSNLSQEILFIRNKIIDHYKGRNLLRKSEGSMIDIEFLSQYLLLNNITTLKNSNFEIPLSVDFIFLTLLDKNVDHSDLKTLGNHYNNFRILEIKKSIFPVSKIIQLEDEALSMKENVLSLFNKYISF